MRSLRALGSDLSVSGVGEERAVAEVQRLEALLTRFRPSPLTRLNVQGELFSPPPELVGEVRHALEVAALTGGRVTPTVLPALEAAGYAAYPGDGRGVGPVAVPGTDGIECGPEVLRLPTGVRLDLGGTAKSWVAERAWACLDGDGFVNAGGDVQLRQSAPFTVEVERPGGGALYLNLPPGEWGVATSSTLRRAWASGHHLIDPATGRPLVSRFVQVTAVAPHVTRAEVLTKLAFLDEARLDALLGDAQVVAFEEGGRMLERTGGRWLECENN